MKTYLFLLLSFTATAAVFAELDVELSFYQEELYFLDSHILLEVRIINKGVTAHSFAVADEIRNSLDVQLRDIHGRLLAPSVQLIRSRNRQRIQYRDVTLLPGEHLVRITPLNDFAVVPTIGLYSVQAMLYPSLYGETKDFVESTILQLTIRPGVTVHDRTSQAIMATKKEVLIQEDLRPDEIISYTLRARQNSDWNRFFTYLDVEALLLQNPSWKTRYERSSEAIKQEILTEFRSTLEQERIEENITAIPSDFTILKTEYGPVDGTVLTEQIFKQSSFETIKQYRYYFERSEYWKIVAYDVLNIGTSAISDS